MSARLAAAALVQAGRRGACELRMRRSAQSNVKPADPFPSPSYPPCPSPRRSKKDCSWAKSASLSTAPCLCNGTAPYLYCHAVASKETAAKLQQTLADVDVNIDPGAPAQRSCWRLLCAYA